MPVDQKAASDIVKIKASVLYSDRSVKSANWWQKALDQFSRWLRNFFRHEDDSASRGGSSQMPSILGPWVVYLMWSVLAALVCVFAYFVLKHVNLRVTLKRRSKALLEEDEPERTLDEWLERADHWERLGEYREAVRCLYLACLLKFDEARVARFDRGQTNWEHLARIEASPTRPAGLDFRSPTQAFDRIWYGMRVRGKADVDDFRRWYLDVSNSVMRRAA